MAARAGLAAGHSVAGSASETLVAAYRRGPPIDRLGWRGSRQRRVSCPRRNVPLEGAAGERHGPVQRGRVRLRLTEHAHEGAWTGTNLQFVPREFIRYANWICGGGGLSALGKNLGLGHGHVDFAGSSARRRGRHSRPQHPARGHRHVHPRVRLVRLQRRLDSRRHGHAHYRRCDEHDAGVCRRRARCLRVRVDAFRKTGRSR